nr:MAG TPA: hypothetical protein [Bacteriophage sp.]
MQKCCTLLHGCCNASKLILFYHFLICNLLFAPSIFFFLET